MNLVLSDETQKLLQERMKKGGYQSPEEVVRAGLAYLEQVEREADFAPGEMSKLLAEADAYIDRGEVLDGEEVFREIKEMSKAYRKTGE